MAALSSVFLGSKDEQVKAENSLNFGVLNRVVVLLKQEGSTGAEPSFVLCYKHKGRSEPAD